MQSAECRVQRAEREDRPDANTHAPFPQNIASVCRAESTAAFLRSSPHILRSPSSSTTSPRLHLAFPGNISCLPFLVPRTDSPCRAAWYPLVIHLVRFPRFRITKPSVTACLRNAEPIANASIVKAFNILAKKIATTPHSLDVHFLFDDLEW